MNFGKRRKKPKIKIQTEAKIDFTKLNESGKFELVNSMYKV